MSRPAVQPALHPGQAQPTLDTLRWIEHTLGAKVNYASALRGGRNNRVFKITTDAAQAVLFKAYFCSDADPRDRLRHEADFTRFAWDLGLRQLPEPIAQNGTLNAALFSFVCGQTLTCHTVQAEHVEQAIDFFRSLNADPTTPEATALPPASEACFTNIDHVALVDRRVRQLDAIAEPAVAAFVERELKPRWAEVHLPIGKADDAFQPTPICVSPSDFGFHNAIVRDDTGQLAFHDFEYAGQDDPAKLLGDFFHQPDIPAPRETYAAFEDAVIDTLALDEAQRHRFRGLLPVYRIKWCSIVLAPLLPDAAERRAFAGLEVDPQQLLDHATRLLHDPLALCP